VAAAAGAPTGQAEAGGDGGNDDESGAEAPRDSTKTRAVRSVHL